jgi:hypothetical protein
VTSQRWTDVVADLSMGWLNWSHDSSSIYFLAANQGSISRVDIKTRNLLKIVDLQSVRPTGGWSSWWLGLSPEDSPLVLRYAGSTEIYAFGWEMP